MCLNWQELSDESLMQEGLRMVRQYKIHTALGMADDKVIDVTNGKVRFYQPANLGFNVTNNIVFSDGIGVLGNTGTTQPDIQFKLETFGDNLAENYTLIRDFVQELRGYNYITLEYQSDIFQVYADLALSEVTKTEGYGKNGQFSETITFNVITKWYTYEQLTLKTFDNSDVIQGISKIYGGTDEAYKYIPDKSYTYYGEFDIERLSRWQIDYEIFSIYATLTPTAKNIDLTKNNPFGIKFFDEDGNNYTSYLFNMTEKPEQITINTDVNNEVYSAVLNGNNINIFSLLNFQAFRTRIFMAGTMELSNLTTAVINIKRKADFI